MNAAILLFGVGFAVPCTYQDAIIALPVHHLSAVNAAMQDGQIFLHPSSVLSWEVQLSYG